jgi:uncharacterized membrane protein YfcA
MLTQLLTFAIGVASGVLSGAFGTGGGATTTIAIRLVLGLPAIVAVATPLPVIIPGAVTGAVSYTRARVADLRAGGLMGLGGALTAVLGAWLATRIGGTFVLLATAALVGWMAVGMVLEAFGKPNAPEPPGADTDPAIAPELVAPAGDTGGLAAAETPASPPLSVMIGAVAGLASGFLGLGGGFILVPLMTRFLGFDMKRAVGTSLVAITIISIPGTLTFLALGKIDWTVVPLLAVGVVLGTWLGARAGLRASDRWLRLGFAVLLFAAALFLALHELLGVA